LKDVPLELPKMPPNMNSSISGKRILKNNAVLDRK
jgi:hypothetical protein